MNYTLKNKITFLTFLCLLIICRNTNQVYASDAINDAFLLNVDNPFSPKYCFTFKRQSLSLLAVGDVMFHNPQIKNAYKSELGYYDFSTTFSAVSPYIKIADYSMANFETTTAGSDRGYSGFPTFNSPDETLDALKGAGFNFLSTANNHSFDKGLKGVYRTIEQVRLRGFDINGTFHPDTQYDTRFLLKEINGIKLGILSLTYGLNGFEASYDSKTLYENVNLIFDSSFVMSQLGLMDDLGVDVSIVFIHWGNEYQLNPSSHQEKLAKDMISWGADIILGSHPHVIQKSEIVVHNDEAKYIIYSMGNFISNQSRNTLPSIPNSKFTEDGVMVYIELERDSPHDSVRIKKVKHYPSWVYKFYDSGALNYAILPTHDYISGIKNSFTFGDKKINISENIKKLILASHEQTMNRLVDYEYIPIN